MLISVALDPRALRGRSSAEFQNLRKVLKEYGALGCSREGVRAIVEAIRATNQQELKRWEDLLMRIPRTDDSIDAEGWENAERDDVISLDGLDTMWIPDDGTFANWVLAEKHPPLTKEFVARPRSPRVEIVAFEAVGDAQMFERLEESSASYLDKVNPRSDLWARMKPLLIRSREMQFVDPFLFGSDSDATASIGSTLEWMCSEIGKLDCEPKLSLHLFGQSHRHWGEEDFEAIADQAWALTNGCLRELQVVPVPLGKFKETGHDRELRFSIMQHSRWIILGNSATAVAREPITKNINCIYRSTVSKVDDDTSRSELEGFRKAANDQGLRGLGVFKRPVAV